ncbi:MAG TPA: MAPEG family protein [Steroidobacteraceae bacterium]|nr:MAPEG family protein [Steroidobacteraceae bacterium]
MPPSRAILLPAPALALWTAAVWFWMYAVRIGEIRRRHLDPQAFARARDAATALENTTPADNLRNLFEVPVLFYALVAFLAITGFASRGLVGAAWLYVLLRVAHSLIHITYNTVMHRFYVYAASTLLLFGMWIVFAARLFAA